MFADDADLLAFERAIKTYITLGISLNCRAVQFVTAGHDIQNQCSIFYGSCQWPDNISAAGHSHDSGTADQTVGWLVTDTAGEAGRLANRAAGISTDGKRCHIENHSRSRPTGTATRHPGFVMWILGREEITILGTATMCKSIKVGFSYADSSFGLKLLNRRRLI